MQMKPIILFRDLPEFRDEKKVMEKYFPVTDSRVGIKDQLVVGRYSVLPFYRELEKDLRLQGSQLVNSPLEHSYIANFDYYEDIKAYTPKTYFSLAEVPKNGGPFVLKGRTNSKKHEWKTKMFAKNYQEVVPIFLELEKDGLISNQGVLVREYVPLKSFGESISGVPFSNEWRMFFYKNELLSYGYYWSSGEILPPKSALPLEAIDFAKEVAAIVSQNTNFFVLDIAEKESGGWVVIEINDGQMSGLSENDPDELYSNLAKALKK